MIGLNNFEESIFMRLFLTLKIPISYAQASIVRWSTFPPPHNTLLPAFSLALSVYQRTRIFPLDVAPGNYQEQPFSLWLFSVLIADGGRGMMAQIDTRLSDFEESRRSWTFPPRPILRSHEIPTAARPNNKTIIFLVSPFRYFSSGTNPLLHCPRP